MGFESEVKVSGLRFRRPEEFEDFWIFPCCFRLCGGGDLARVFCYSASYVQ